jgi:hypothetical protein
MAGKKKGPVSATVLIFYGENARLEQLERVPYVLHCIAQLHAIFEFIRCGKGHVPSSAQLEATRRIHLLLLSQSSPSYSCVSDGLQARAAEPTRYMAESEIRCKGVGTGRDSRDPRSNLDGPWKSKH